MPTYDYECAACGHMFEVFEGIHVAGSKPCPKCRKGKAKRRITASAGVIFKGGGFYVNDSKNSSSQAPEAKKKTTRKKADASGSKPEPTSEKTEKK